MSLIQPSIFPRSMMDMDLWNRPLGMNMDLWNRPLGTSLSPLSPASPFSRLNDPFDAFGPTSLDLFDPFSDLDRLMSKNISWLTEPSILPPRLSQTLAPQKYRITLDCSGFSENSIQTSVKDNVLTISASEGDPSLKGTSDYVLRELKKTYELPNYVDTNRLVSFMTNQGILVVEFPWKDEFVTSNLLPKVDQENKQVTLDVTVPADVDTNRLHVTCKDHDLIIRADYRVKNDDGSTRSRVHYLRRATLPENTNVDQLKCTVENDLLKVSAPLGPHHRKRVPIEFKHQQPQLQMEQ